MAFVANHDEFVAFFVELGHFNVHLGDQRASGIKNGEAARFCFCLNGFANAMCAEHQGGAWRYIA